MSQRHPQQQCARVSAEQVCKKRTRLALCLIASLISLAGFADFDSDGAAVTTQRSTDHIALAARLSSLEICLPAQQREVPALMGGADHAGIEGADHMLDGSSLGAEPLGVDADQRAFQRARHTVPVAGEKFQVVGAMIW